MTGLCGFDRNGSIAFCFVKLGIVVMCRVALFVSES